MTTIQISHLDNNYNNLEPTQNQNNKTASGHKTKKNYAIYCDKMFLIIYFCVSFYAHTRLEERDALQA